MWETTLLALAFVQLAATFHGSFQQVLFGSWMEFWRRDEGQCALLSLVSLFAIGICFNFTRTWFSPTSFTFATPARWNNNIAGSLLRQQTHKNGFKKGFLVNLRRALDFLWWKRRVSNLKVLLSPKLKANYLFSRFPRWAHLWLVWVRVLHSGDRSAQKVQVGRVRAKGVLLMGTKKNSVCKKSKWKKVFFCPIFLNEPNSHVGQNLSRHRFWQVGCRKPWRPRNTISKEQRPRNQLFVPLFFIFFAGLCSLFSPIVLIPVRPNRGLLRRRLRPRRRRPGGRRPFYKIDK